MALLSRQVCWFFPVWVAFRSCWEQRFGDSIVLTPRSGRADLPAAVMRGRRGASCDRFGCCPTEARSDCEASARPSLTPKQVLGTHREPERRAMWWDSQGPHPGLGRGLGCLGRWPVVQAVEGSTPSGGGALVGSAGDLRGPLSSWRMLELGKSVARGPFSRSSV